MNTTPDRPDYVPTWWMGSSRRRLFSDPRRLARRMIMVPLLAIVVTVVLFAAGATVEGAVALAWALTEVATAAVYVPRALRAARRAEQRLG